MEVAARAARTRSRVDRYETRSPIPQLSTPTFCSDRSSVLDFPRGEPRAVPAASGMGSPCFLQPSPGPEIAQAEARRTHPAFTTAQIVRRCVNTPRKVEYSPITREHNCRPIGSVGMGAHAPDGEAW